MHKQATSTTVYKSVPHVVKDFVIALAAAFPGKFKAEVFDDLVQGVAAEEASVVAVAGVLPLHEVDATGKVKDPLALLREKGFDVGSVVVYKDREGAMKIVKVSTGASAMVTLQDPSGSTVLEVKLEDVLEKWSLAASAQLVEKHPGWPKARRNESVTFQLLCARGAIFMGLGSLAQQVDKFFHPAEKLQIFWKPQRKVVASAVCAPGALVLSPESLTVKTVAAGQAVDGAGLQVEVSPAIPDHTFWITGTATAENVSAFWVVATTAEESKANMALAKYTVSSLVGMDYFGEVPLVPKQAARVGRKAPAKKPDDEASAMTIHIPILVNTKALAVGDELLWYKQATVKRERAPEPITVSKLARKSGQWCFDFF